MEKNTTIKILNYAATIGIRNIAISVLVSGFVGLLVAKLLRSRLLGALSFLYSNAVLLYFSPTQIGILFVLLTNAAFVVAFKAISFLLNYRKRKRWSKWRSRR